MPISAIDGCTESHWKEVLHIILESISSAELEGNLVSNADDVGIIQKRIVQNLYDNPVVVCDVSGKNPNVMFELGMRLAFDKPTVIIKDDKTSYSFDTSAIEHLEYPRDLRFSKIVEFKQKLAEKILATLQRSTQDANYTTFLKHFGEFKVAKIDKKEVSGQEFILQELQSMKRTLRKLEVSSTLRNEPGDFSHASKYSARSDFDINLKGLSKERMHALKTAVDAIQGVVESTVVESTGDIRLLISLDTEMAIPELIRLANEFHARGYSRASFNQS